MDLIFDSLRSDTQHPTYPQHDSFWFVPMLQCRRLDEPSV